ncbi:membrane protein insertion efficiency factor YidD [Aureimonas glaciei]|uniref:membrane protein insertion efficiency factor YidD n=1 Tax=Aureimonas glaciei TaxID=1776957 RepID=UPI001666DEFF
MRSSRSRPSRAGRLSRPERLRAHRHSRNFDGPWRKTPGRLVGTGLVRLYQLTFSGFVGGHCRHIPTCSEYGYEAIARHGLIPGGWLTLKRIARCGPFGGAGLDPVPTPKNERTLPR